MGRENKGQGHELWDDLDLGIDQSPDSDDSDGQMDQSYDAAGRLTDSMQQARRIEDDVLQEIDNAGVNLNPPEAQPLDANGQITSNPVQQAREIKANAEVSPSSPALRLSETNITYKPRSIWSYLISFLFKTIPFVLLGIALLDMSYIGNFVAAGTVGVSTAILLCIALPWIFYLFLHDNKSNTVTPIPSCETVAATEEVLEIIRRLLLPNTLPHIRSQLTKALRLHIGTALELLDSWTGALVTYDEASGNVNNFQRETDTKKLKDLGLKILLNQQDLKDLNTIFTRLKDKTEIDKDWRPSFSAAKARNFILLATVLLAGCATVLALTFTQVIPIMLSATGKLAVVMGAISLGLLALMVGVHILKNTQGGPYARLAFAASIVAITFLTLNGFAWAGFDVGLSSVALGVITPFLWIATIALSIKAYVYATQAPQNRAQHRASKTYRYSATGSVKLLELCVTVGLWFLAFLCVAAYFNVAGLGLFSKMQDQVMGIIYKFTGFRLLENGLEWFKVFSVAIFATAAALARKMTGRLLQRSPSRTADISTRTPTWQTRFRWLFNDFFKLALLISPVAVFFRLWETDAFFTLASSSFGLIPIILILVSMPILAGNVQLPFFARFNKWFAQLGKPFSNQSFQFSYLIKREAKVLGAFLFFLIFALAPGVPHVLAFAVLGGSILVNLGIRWTTLVWAHLKEPKKVVSDYLQASEIPSSQIDYRDVDAANIENVALFLDYSPHQDVTRLRFKVKRRGDPQEKEIIFGWEKGAAYYRYQKATDNFSPYSQLPIPLDPESAQHYQCGFDFISDELNLDTDPPTFSRKEHSETNHPILQILRKFMVGDGVLEKDHPYSGMEQLLTRQMKPREMFQAMVDIRLDANQQHREIHEAKLGHIEKLKDDITRLGLQLAQAHVKQFAHWSASTTNEFISALQEERAAKVRELLVAQGTPSYEKLDKKIQAYLDKVEVWVEVGNKKGLAVGAKYNGENRSIVSSRRGSAISRRNSSVVASAVITPAAATIAAPPTAPALGVAPEAAVLQNELQDVDLRLEPRVDGAIVVAPEGRAGASAAATAAVTAPALGIVSKGEALLNDLEDVDLRLGPRVDGAMAGAPARDGLVEASAAVAPASSSMSEIKVPSNELQNVKLSSTPANITMWQKVKASPGSAGVWFLLLLMLLASLVLESTPGGEFLTSGYYFALLGLGSLIFAYSLWNHAGARGLSREKGLKLQNWKEILEFGLKSISFILLCTLALLAGLSPAGATFSPAVLLSLIAVTGMLVSYFFARQKLFESRIEVVWRLLSIRSPQNPRSSEIDETLRALRITPDSIDPNAPVVKDRISAIDRQLLLRFLDAALLAMAEISEDEKNSHKLTIWDGKTGVEALDQLKQDQADLKLFRSAVGDTTPDELKRNFEADKISKIRAICNRFETCRRSPNSDAPSKKIMLGLMVLPLIGIVVASLALVLNIGSFTANLNMAQMAGWILGGFTFAFVAIKGLMEYFRQHSNSFAEWVGKRTRFSRRLSAERIIVWFVNIALLTLLSIVAFVSGTNSNIFMAAGIVAITWTLGQVLASNAVQARLQKVVITDEKARLAVENASPADGPVSESKRSSEMENKKVARNQGSNPMSGLAELNNSSIVRDALNGVSPPQNSAPQQHSRFKLLTNSGKKQQARNYFTIATPWDKHAEFGANTVMRSYFVLAAGFAAQGNSAVLNNPLFSFFWNLVNSIFAYPSIKDNAKNNPDPDSWEKVQTSFEKMVAVCFFTTNFFSVAAQEKPGAFGSVNADISALSGFSFALAMTASLLRTAKNLSIAWDEMDPRCLLENKIKELHKIEQKEQPGGDSENHGQSIRKEQLCREILAIARVAGEEIYQDHKVSVIDLLQHAELSAQQKNNLIAGSKQSPLPEEVLYVKTQLKENEQKFNQMFVDFMGQLAAAVCSWLLALAPVLDNLFVNAGDQAHLFLVIGGIIKACQIIISVFQKTDKWYQATHLRKQFLSDIAPQINSFAEDGAYTNSSVDQTEFKKFFKAANPPIKDAALQANYRIAYYLRIDEVRQNNYSPTEFLNSLQADKHRDEILKVALEEFAVFLNTNSVNSVSGIQSILDRLVKQKCGMVGASDTSLQDVRLLVSGELRSTAVTSMLRAGLFSGDAKAVAPRFVNRPRQQGAHEADPTTGAILIASSSSSSLSPSSSSSLR